MTSFWCSSYLLGCAVVGVTLCSGVALAQPQISESDRRDAIALGQRCEAPIVRVPGGPSDFILYVESPAARVALVAAAALLMRQPLDSPGVQRALKPGYRLWLVPGPRMRATRWVTAMRIVSRAGELNPIAIGDEKFFLGSVPSHGIVPEIRDRRPLFTFASVPMGAFDVRVQFNDGTRSYRVRHEPRQPIRVCN